MGSCILWDNYFFNFFNFFYYVIFIFGIGSSFPLFLYSHHHFLTLHLLPNTYLYCFGDDGHVSSLRLSWFSVFFSFFCFYFRHFFPHRFPSPSDPLGLEHSLPCLLSPHVVCFYSKNQIVVTCFDYDWPISIFAVFVVAIFYFFIPFNVYRLMFQDVLILHWPHICCNTYYLILTSWIIFRLWCVSWVLLC